MIAALLGCIAAAILIFHGGTYLLWLYEARRHGACAGAAIFSWRAWGVEGASLLLVLLTWPFGLRSPKRRPFDRAIRPVLLVHGWSLNRASMVAIAFRLERDGRTAVAINYPSLLDDTDVKVLTVAREIRRLAASSPDGHVDIVGHGLGGVLVRVAARDAELRALIGNVVTLGSPHHGTALAVLGTRHGLLQIRPGSRFIARLTDEDRFASDASVTTIASPFDAIVFPTDTAHLSGALNVTVDAIGHHALLYSKRIYTLLRENLELPLRRAAA
jgi:triacylglycerol esterase/lipase EstA (alpha/beta hydrolase family)